MTMLGILIGKSQFASSVFQSLSRSEFEMGKYRQAASWLTQFSFWGIVEI
jgi:hypothetical protein